MRKFIFFSLLISFFVAFLSCSNISISNISIADKSGEGYSVRNRRGVTTIRAFSRKEQEQKDSLTLYADQFVIHSLNGEQLRQMLQEDQLTWVAVWSSWSESSLEQLPSYKRKAERMGLELVLVCSGLDLSTIARKLKEADFKGIAYILDNKYYRGIEINRIIDFRKDIYPDCPLTRFEMPHHYLFDGNKLVYFTEGFIRTDSIQAKMK